MSNQDSLKEHQQVMLQMLIEVDRICRKYDIKYSLFAGTMLGAIRHKGFIPWDDDLDIIMLRSEYNRFLSVAQNEIDNSRFFVQKEFSNHWPMFFSKIRKNGTCCIERYIPKDYDTHMGVYIDIFPCDNLSDFEVIRRMQFLASKFVIANSLGKRGYLTNSILKKLFIMGCRIISVKWLNAFVQMHEKRNTKQVHSFFAAASKYKKNIYDRAWFSELTNCEFEGQQFLISSHYDEVLTILYGDYMIPTPPGERENKVHGEIVDLHNSYETYRGVQEHMVFKELTRSIR